MSDGGTTRRTPLADLPPGQELLVRLAELRDARAEASDADLIDGMIGFGRLKGAAEGGQLGLLAEFARRRAVPAPTTEPSTDHGVNAGTKDAPRAGTEDAAGAGTETSAENAAGAATAPEAGVGDVVVDEFCADEVSCALTLHRLAAHDRIHLALSLTRRLPAVLRALLAGQIDLYKAQLIHEMTEHLDPKDAARPPANQDHQARQHQRVRHQRRVR